MWVVPLSVLVPVTMSECQEDGSVLSNGVPQTRVWSQSVRESAPHIQTNAGKSAVCGGVKSRTPSSLHRLLWTPSLVGHAICDHHSSAIVTNTTVNKDFLAWVFSDQGEKVRKGSVLRERALPMHGNVLHAQTGYFLAFAFAISPQIDDDLDSHRGQGLKTMFVRLGAPVERRTYLREVRD
jgi:hypothetical protein